MDGFSISNIPYPLFSPPTAGSTLRMVGVSDVDLERWGDYLEDNGVVFVISIIGVNVVQNLISHFRHPLVEVIILLSVYLSIFYILEW